MKKIIFILFTICTATIGKAGDIKVLSGDLSVVNNPSITATVRFDYAALYIEDQPYMEYLEKRGADFVRNWPSESQMSEDYFIKCWNHDYKKGMKLSVAAKSDYMMVIVVNEMDMGSGAASYFIGFGAGGAKMSGMMYLFKGNNHVPLLTVEIDGQTGRSGLTEMVRRNDLYGELAEDMVKAIQKTKPSKLSSSSAAVSLPSVLLIGETDENKPALAEAKTEMPVEAPVTTEPNDIPVEPALTEATTQPTPPAPTKTTVNSSIPAAVLAAESSLTLDKKGMAGNFSMLKSENRMSVYLDYSDALLDNRSEEEFIQYMTYGVRDKERDSNFAESWEKSIKPKILHTFISMVNEELEDEKLSLILASKQGYKYTLKIKVIDVNDDGDNKCDYLVVETATGEVVAHIRLEADGGSFGKYIGLIEQGMEAAGEEFGKVFAKKIKKDK